MSATYDPTKFTVMLPGGLESTVSKLTTHEAEQCICHLLQTIRQIQISQLIALESTNRKLEQLGLTPSK
jgi:hypothetical protein